MRLALTVAMISIASSAFADGPADRFSTSWTGLPTTHFSAWDHAPRFRIVAAHPAAVPVGDVAAATAYDPAERRDLAVNEIAAGWEPARRAALEDLRDAQRQYAIAAGGDSEVRGQRFVALLNQVVDDHGRSAARAPSTGADEALNAIYDRVIRAAPDERLATIENAQEAWVAYRDAFGRFALAMDRPDVASRIGEDLARQRAEELPAEAGR